MITIKHSILLSSVALLLILTSCDDDIYQGGVSEKELPGLYTIEPYTIIDSGKEYNYKDTLEILVNGTTNRREYSNGLLISSYQGNWHYLLQNRYSIGIDMYSNDIEPERSILSGKIRIVFPPSYIYYKR